MKKLKQKVVGFMSRLMEYLKSQEPPQNPIEFTGRYM